MVDAPRVPTNPFVIALTGQRFFNQNLLLALIEAGALTQYQAGAVAGKTANEIRDFEGPNGTAFGSKMADLFESVASDILGLKPLPREPT